MHNYFKAIVGHLAPKSGHREPKASTLQWETFPFDDNDTGAALLAYRAARAAFKGGAVSVWCRRGCVPDGVPEIGEMVDPDLVVLQPGQKGTAGSRAAQVDGILDFADVAGSGLMAAGM